MNKWLIALLAAVAAGVIAWVVETQVINTHKQKYDAVYTVRFQPKDSSSTPEDASRTIEKIKELLTKARLKSTITPAPGNSSLYTISVNDMPDSTWLTKLLTMNFGVRFYEVCPPDSTFTIWDDLRAVKCELYPTDCPYTSQKEDTSITAQMLAEIEKSGMDGYSSISSRSPVELSEILRADAKDTAVIGAIFRHPKVKGLLPEGVRAYFVKVRGAGRVSKDNYEFALYLLYEHYRDGSPLLTGAEIESAEESVRDDGIEGDYSGIIFRFTEEGAHRWERLTTNNVGGSIAIIADGKLVSAPQVRSPVNGRDVELSGGLEHEQVVDILPAFQAGGVEFPTTPVIESSQLTAAPAGSKFPLIPLSVFVLVFAVTMLVFKTLKSTRPAPVSGEKRA